jgi:hypothetical protein
MPQIMESLMFVMTVTRLLILNLSVIILHVFAKIIMNLIWIVSSACKYVEMESI